MKNVAKLPLESDRTGLISIMTDLTLVPRFTGSGPEFMTEVTRKLEISDPRD
jgi:hypothetical protein